MINFNNDNKLIIAVLLILILSQIRLFQCFLLKWTKEYKVRQVQESASLKVKKVPIKYECQLIKVVQWTEGVNTTVIKMSTSKMEQQG